MKGRWKERGQEGGFPFGGKREEGVIGRGSLQHFMVEKVQRLGSQQNWSGNRKDPV